MGAPAFSPAEKNTLYYFRIDPLSKFPAKKKMSKQWVPNKVPAASEIEQITGDKALVPVTTPLNPIVQNLFISCLHFVRLVRQRV